MTARGGTSALGVLLGVNPDGSGYTIEHSFLGGPNDGNGPVGTPIEFNGSTATGAGGTANDGVVYSFSPIPEPSSLLLLAAATFAVPCSSAAEGPPKSCCRACSHG